MTRTFSSRQLADVARAFLSKYPRMQLVLNVDAAQRTSAEMRELLAEFPAQVMLHPPDGTVVALFQVIAEADAVLTPDTGISHVATPTSTPVVVAFDDVEFNPICRRPLTEEAICQVPDKGRSRNCPPANLSRRWNRLSPVEHRHRVTGMGSVLTRYPQIVGQ